MTKPTKWSVHPVKTQISLGISMCAQWVNEDPMFLYMNGEDSDQTEQMPRLTWVFTGRKGHFVGFVMRCLTQGYRNFEI